MGKNDKKKRKSRSATRPEDIASTPVSEPLIPPVLSTGKITDKTDDSKVTESKSDAVDNLESYNKTAYKYLFDLTVNPSPSDVIKAITDTVKNLYIDSTITNDLVNNVLCSDTILNRLMADNSFWSDYWSLFNTFNEQLRKTSQAITQSNILSSVAEYYQRSIDSNFRIFLNTVGSLMIARIIRYIIEEKSISIAQQQLYSLFSLNTTVTQYLNRKELSGCLVNLSNIESNAKMYTSELVSYSKTQEHLHDLSLDIQNHAQLLVSMDSFFATFSPDNVFLFISKITPEQIKDWRSKLSDLVSKGDVESSVALRTLSFLIDKISHVRLLLTSNDVIQSSLLSLPSLSVSENLRGFESILIPYDVSVEAYEKCLSALSLNIFSDSEPFTYIKKFKDEEFDVGEALPEEFFSSLTIDDASSLYDKFFPVNITLLNALFENTGIVIDSFEYNLFNVTPVLIRENGELDEEDYMDRESLLVILADTSKNSFVQVSDKLSLPLDLEFVYTSPSGDPPAIDELFNLKLESVESIKDFEFVPKLSKIKV